MNLNYSRRAIPVLKYITLHKSKTSHRQFITLNVPINKSTKLRYPGGIFTYLYVTINEESFNFFNHLSI